MLQPSYTQSSNKSRRSLRRVLLVVPARELLRRLPRVCFGLILFGVGIAMMVAGDLGLGPWDVFHQGASSHLGLSIGVMIEIVGVLLLLLWIPLRQKPGVGTLLNALVGQKVSITSSKAQTTRHRITGIRSVDEAQFVFVDTPGFQTQYAAALNRTLNRTVHSVLADVDVVLFVVEAGRFGLDDAKVLSLVPPDMPTLLLANKVDKLARRADLLPNALRRLSMFVLRAKTRLADAREQLAVVGLAGAPAVHPGRRAPRRRRAGAGRQSPGPVAGRHRPRHCAGSQRFFRLWHPARSFRAAFR